MKHGEVKMVLIWRLHSYWLVFMVLEGILYTVIQLWGLCVNYHLLQEKASLMRAE